MIILVVVRGMSESRSKEINKDVFVIFTFCMIMFCNRVVMVESDRGG